MKKILIAMLVVLCMIFGLVACGGGTSDPIQPDEVIIDTSDDITTAESEAPAVEDPTVDQVLFDQNGIKITCNGYDMGDEWDFGPSLKFMVENSTDKNITVQVRDCSINGFMIDPTCSADVAAGKKANDDMTWFASEFEENEIEEIETIEFFFHIFDADEWETIVDSDVITLNFN